MKETSSAGHAINKRNHAPDDVTGLFPVTLNDRWRVVDDPLQWTLQYRAGNVSHSDEVKNRKAWKGVHFCRTSAALKRCIREYCGEVDPMVMTIISTWPEWHDAARHLHG